MSNPSDPSMAAAPLWKRIVASILDFIMIASVGGYVIGALTGGLKPGGFELNGWPAVLWLAAIIGYFYWGRRLAGGTLWDRFFGIVRPQPW
jgi:uncharacterized RDD family membrane protein YckC